MLAVVLQADSNNSLVAVHTQAGARSQGDSLAVHTQAGAVRIQAEAAHTQAAAVHTQAEEHHSPAEATGLRQGMVPTREALARQHCLQPNPTTSRAIGSKRGIEHFAPCSIGA